jgi:hypothetical protein
VNKEVAKERFLSFAFLFGFLSRAIKMYGMIQFLRLYSRLNMATELSAKTVNMRSIE